MFLTSDRQFAPALAWIDSLLKKNPADPGLLMVKSKVLLEQGNVAESLRLARKVCDSHEAGEVEYSHAARIALLAGNIDDRAIADSEKAVEMAQGKKSLALLTLASIWAEKGKVNDAMMLLQRGLQASGGGQGISEDDFVCGRVAEQMGMPDVAQFYYDRVMSSERLQNPTSTSALVAKRRGKMKTASHQKSSPVR
jgi:tetratricopeptide (TPR) repeat protein